MVISMLGAVAESAMALAASLSEVVEQDENMSLDQFKNQREIISQQFWERLSIPSFLEFWGQLVGLILWFVTFKLSLADIFNSKFADGRSCRHAFRNVRDSICNLAFWLFCSKIF